MVKVKFSDGTEVEMTAGHPLYDISKKEWQTYEERAGNGKLCVGSEIMTLNGSKKIVSIEEYEGKDIYVYNLIIECKDGQNCHNYFANGSLAHNAGEIC